MRVFRDRYLHERRGQPLAVLDVGAMDVNGSYRDLFDDARWTYRGVDLEAGRNVDIVLERPYALPLASASQDVIISGQALEHMPYFWLFFLEVFRCLKPDGLACIIAPSAGYEHRHPVDCWRFYPDGMSAAARFARLEPVEIYTDWQPVGDYDDDSRVWQDSVLIARKPALSAWRHIKLAGRAWVLGWLGGR